MLSGLPHSFYTWQREVRIGESASATAFWVLIAFGPAGLVAINVLGLFIDQGAIATHLIAIDNDPIAVTATRENVDRNELAVPIVASTKPLDQFTDTFDLVVANILATVIKRLKVELYRTTAEGGFLLLSGILETERRSVEETFLELGANHLSSETMGDWCSILLQKPAP